MEPNGGLSKTASATDRASAWTGRGGVRRLTPTRMPLPTGFRVGRGFWRVKEKVGGGRYVSNQGSCQSAVVSCRSKITAQGAVTKPCRPPDVCVIANAAAERLYRGRCALMSHRLESKPRFVTGSQVSLEQAPRL